MQQNELGAKYYITTFYNDVHALTTIYGDYHNVISEINFKGVPFEDITDSSRDTIILAVNSMRRLVEKTFVYYQTIVKNSKQFKPNDDLVNSYNLMRNEYIISCDNLLKYIQALNQFLVDDVIEYVIFDEQVNQNVTIPK